MRRTSTQTASICCKLDHSTAQAVENSEVTVTAMVPAKGGDEAKFLGLVNDTGFRSSGQNRIQFEIRRAKTMFSRIACL